jgi:hypothetical protein
MTRRTGRKLADAEHDSRACVIEESVPAGCAGPIQNRSFTIGKCELSRVEVAMAQRIAVRGARQNSFDPFEMKGLDLLSAIGRKPWLVCRIGGLTGKAHAQLNATRAPASERQHFPPGLDPSAAGRFILETVTMFGRHRYADPDPQPLDDTAVRETVVRLIVRALVLHQKGT